MALTNYKTIEDRKGYLVSEDDRKVFESGTQKTNFGLGVDDHIEFILYDSNDNQLPQGDSQSLVRYIPVNDESSRKYFIKSDYKDTPLSPSQFIVDIEKLIKEAGYSNGIFKTSTTLINRRIGRERPTNSKNFNNQLWIQEISPSRTEIRVLPLNPTGESNKDVEKRYSIFTRDSQFRDDGVYFIDEFIESVKVENVLKNFVSSKGKVTSGQNYISLVKREFGIYNFEDFVRRIEEDWKKSIKSYFYNDSSDVELSNKTLEEVSRSLLIKVIEKYLPKREVTEKSILTKDELETFDRVKTLLKTLQDKNKEFVSAELKYKSGEISGCTDPNSLNYNPDATIDDGSCKYKEDETTDDVDKKDTNEDTTTEDGTSVISVRLKNNLVVEGLLNYQIPGKASKLEDGNESFSLDITDSPKKLRIYSPGGLPLNYEFNSVIKNIDDEVIATYIYPGYEISLVEDVIIETTLKEKSSDTEEEETTNSADGTNGSPTTPSGAGGID